MPSYGADKRRVDRFEPEIKRILGEHLIATAGIYADQKQATDLLVLTLAPLTVGCRVRRYDALNGFDPKYGEAWYEQFTVRAARPSNVETELSKITNGWGDYGFYGFADEADERIVMWTIYRYSHLRYGLVWEPDVRKRLRDHIPNKDGSSTFACFGFKQFPGEMVVAEGGDFLIGKWAESEYERIVF